MNPLNAVSTCLLATCLSLSTVSGTLGSEPDHPLPDTGQIKCYGTLIEMACPALGETLYGQDAQHQGNEPSYTLHENGTVTDNVTGLMWRQSPDLNQDGTINISDKRTYPEAKLGESESFAGYSDWRLPSIKELYSLIDFSGVDPSGFQGSDMSQLVPFIDRGTFAFGWGDSAAGERIIDAQFASDTLSVSGTGPRGDQTVFGVNFADGRIKGYGLNHPRGEKTFYVLYVRGDQGYGENDFVENGDGSISDLNSGLMWTQADSSEPLDWPSALAYVAHQNEVGYLGYSDWRLPNAKELQSIVDYSRSPDTSDSAAIDMLFDVTPITNEAGDVDYPAYWTSTTHVNWTSHHAGANAAYISFGRSLGNMRGWIDVHGAGSQRSDPKEGDPARFEGGHGPQGDAIRIYNFVRLVRDK